MVPLIEILHILFFLSILTPFFIFGVYGVIILYYGKKSCEKNNLNNFILPFVTIVVPTHNEESIISKKIENLMNSNYPKEKLELIFVDDSDDSTSEIIKMHAKNISIIRLIKFKERKGYSPSMLEGCKAAKGEIIVLTDAHSFFDEKTILNLVRNFRNQNIGAVTSRSSIMNINENVALSENLYMDLYNKMRVAETNLDSTFWFKGEASAIRKNIIEDLEECHATFDTAVAIYARKKGFKSIFDPEVKFYEYAPRVRSERIKQKTIRAANILKIIFYFKEMMFNPRYGRFGMIILPMNFAILIIAPLAMLSSLVLLVTLTFLDFYFSIYFWGIIGLVSLFIFIFYKQLLNNLFDLTYSIIKALYQILFTRIEHDKIEKIMSTRKT